ncbi:succinate dehydrogenase, hydrophobic membrane anchor protein [Thiohalorhabdus sp.]|uniref:succinate dehydrogenase, hydrophobic membrane anchor protein n=1 Tax=Thiohalorhabdus sp. TaxID=3094134 RepID=UPI002FC35475
MATEPGGHGGGFRDAGASRTGLWAWWWQRLSALYIAAFLVLGIVWLTVAPPSGYGQWRIWLAYDAVRLALALFVAAVGVHAYIGARDIMMDYVPEGVVRNAAVVIWVLVAAAFLAWGWLWVVDLGAGP